MWKNFKKQYVFILIIIGLCFIFRRFIFGPFLYLFLDIGNDTVALFYPKMVHAMPYFKSEGIPLWSFANGIGQNIYSSSFLSPFNFPKLLLNSTQIAYAIVYMQLAKILFTSFLFYKYLSLLKLHERTIWIGTLLFTFNGFLLVSSSWYDHTNFIMNFVLTLLSLELLLQKRIWWPLTITIFYMFGTKIYFIFEFSIIYSIIRLIDTESFNKKGITTYVIDGLKGIGLSLFLIAPFVGSIIYKLVYSPRVGGEVSFVDSLSSTPMFKLAEPLEYWSSILRTFSSDIFGSGGAYQGFINYLEGPNFYIGIFCLILFPQVFMNIKLKQKIVYGAIVAFWVMIIAFPFFRYAFYAFAGNYFKSGISIFLPFTMLYFTLIGMDQFFRNGKLNLILLWITSSLLLLILYIPKDVSQLIVTEVQTVVAIFIIAYTIILSLSKKTINQNIVFAMLTLLVFSEALYMGNSNMKIRLAVEKNEISRKDNERYHTKEIINDINKTNEPFYRIEKPYGSFNASGYNDAQLYGYFGTKSYKSHNHRYYVSFLREMEMLLGTEEKYTRWLVGLVSGYFIHGIFSVKYMLTTPETDKYIWQFSYEDLGEKNGIHIYRNKNYIPLGIPFDSYITRSDFNGLSNKEQKQMSLYSGIIVEDNNIGKIGSLKRFYPNDILTINEIPDLADNLKSKAMKMEHFSQNKIEGSINLDTESMVFFSFPFDVGWSAKVDGKKVDLQLINIGMCGILVEPGKHQIVLTFRPPFFREGWTLFALGFIFLGYLIFNYVKNQKTAQLPEKHSKV